MRLFKLLFMILVATVVALVYVHQQVELVKLSYSIDYKERKLKDILDRKESLEYNIANLEDPSRLERILLAKNIDISFPKKGQVFKSAQRAPRMTMRESLGSASLERKGLILNLLEFFSLKAEAQAEEREILPHL